MTKTQKIIEKWYKLLKFPKEYDEEFYQILEEIPVPEGLRVEDTDPWSPYGKENLLRHLYFAEQLGEKYKEKGIPESVLIDTLKDIVTWTKTWSNVRGELWLEETHWLRLHFGMRLFALGRLHFFIVMIPGGMEELGIADGEGFVDVHIPEGGPLDYEQCVESFRMADEFFPKFFPEIPYRVYLCDSWLLDDTLKNYLRPDSNIVKFQSLFTPIRKRPENEIIHCIFTKDTTEENLAEKVATSSFAQKVKDHVLNGGTFYAVMGRRERGEQLQL